MGNYILCYNTGSGIIHRVVNADAIPFASCGTSVGENKVSASSDNDPVYYTDRRFSGSLAQLANGTGTLMEKEETKWYINGVQLSESMDVSVASSTPFNLNMEVVDGSTDSKVSTLSYDGLSKTSPIQPVWMVESVVAPDDYDSVVSYKSVTSSLYFQPYTNGEATMSIDLSTDSNRVYALRTMGGGNGFACNLIKD
jgi:hypothetical protein